MKIYGDSQRAIGFGGNTATAMKVKNAEVVLGDQFDHQTFYSLDLDAISKGIEAKTSYKISGIIGTDLLKKYNCVIDYNQRQLVLVDSRVKVKIAAR